MFIPLRHLFVAWDQDIENTTLNFSKDNSHSRRQPLLTADLAPTGLFSPQYFANVPLYQSFRSRAAAPQFLII